MIRVFTTGQVAKVCKVAARTVSKWFDSGMLKGYRIPGSQDRRIPRDNLIRFLKAHNMPLGNLEEEERYKILVVGAEKLFNERLEFLLPAADGFGFDHAITSFQAGCTLRQFGPNAVVIDLGIGRSDALVMARILRTADHAGLIVGLAGEDEADPEAMTGMGFDRVFKKPFDIALLAEVFMGQRKIDREKDEG